MFDATRFLRGELEPAEVPEGFDGGVSVAVSPLQRDGARCGGTEQAGEDGVRLGGLR